MIKKIFLGVGSIAVITVIGIVIATNTSVKADAEVTMKQYNELVSRIDNLETKLEEANNKITILEEKITNQEKTINEYETKINNTNSSLSSVIKKTDNFEKWQDKFFELVESTSGLRPDSISWGGIFRSLEEYRQTLEQ
jgi:peptidoglycan hydrolase CwlO-like protein